MRGILTFVATWLAFGSSPAVADDHEQDDVAALAAVEAFMDAFNAGDAEGMEAKSLTDASVTLIEERDGEDSTRTLPLPILITQISSAQADLKEPIWDMEVWQDGPVATVLAKFEFLIDGQRSHCGTNIFTLIRLDGEWKINGITYSHIKEGCIAAPQP